MSSSSTINNSSTSIINPNSTIINNGKCPDYFYELLNQSIVLPTDNGDNSNTNQNNSDFCQQAPDYSIRQKIGSYPAIYYFGQSFQSTLLTTFFTLFNVIGAIGRPVSIQNKKFYSSFDFFLESWI
jgi:hypothetical protein